ncbi:MAG TPA: porin family protein [Gemmatimonadales bacterium]|nr:porin family protein [Gemmatimonadales bacterium]
MRILVLLLLGLAAVMSELEGQGPRAAVGAQVGYSRSDLSGTDADQIRSRQGALTGVFLYFPVGAGLALRPELLFSLKGGRTLAVLEGGGTATLDIELAYLELPVLAHFSLPTGRFRPVVFGGPAPALQLGCDLQLIVQPEPIRATCREAEITFRDWDLGLVLGGGVEAHLNRATLALEARYTAGFRSILDDARIDNRTFAILLALTF